MAPEIFQNYDKINKPKSYDKKCDIWSLGTMLYEIIFGKIIGNNIKTMLDIRKLLISKDELTLPKSGRIISDSLKNLLKSILKKNPKERLDINQILEHEWMSAFEEKPL